MSENESYQNAASSREPAKGSTKLAETSPGGARKSKPPCRPLQLAVVLAGGGVAFVSRVLFSFVILALVGADSDLDEQTVILVSGALGYFFAGCFTTAAARHSNYRHLLWATMWIAVVDILFLGVSESLPVAGLYGSVWFLSMSLGGSAEVWLMSKTGTREKWNHKTVSDDEIPVSAPPRFALLSRLWFTAALVSVGTAVVLFDLRVLFFAFACFQLGRRHDPKSVRNAMQKDERQPVVYLRSFRDDGTTMEDDLGWWYQFTQSMKSLINKTFEQRLDKHMKQLGPFVGIGRPDEEIAELGAARMYVVDEYWQELIFDFMRRSQMVVLQVGETMGLQWELKTVTEQLKPEQVLLFVPRPVRGGWFRTTRLRAERHQFYHAFYDWASPAVGGGLPDSIGDGYFLYFEPGEKWIARVLEFRSPPKEHPNIEILTRLSRDKAFKPYGWRPLWERIVIWTLILILAVFMAVLAAGLLSN